MAEYTCCSSVAFERPNENTFTLHLHPSSLPPTGLAKRWFRVCVVYLRSEAPRVQQAVIVACNGLVLLSGSESRQAGAVGGPCVSGRPGPRVPSCGGVQGCGACVPHHPASTPRAPPTVNDCAM